MNRVANFFNFFDIKFADRVTRELCRWSHSSCGWGSGLGGGNLHLIIYSLVVKDGVAMQNAVTQFWIWINPRVMIDDLEDIWMSPGVAVVTSSYANQVRLMPSLDLETVIAFECHRGLPWWRHHMQMICWLQLAMKFIQIFFVWNWRSWCAPRRFRRIDTAVCTTTNTTR